MIGNIKYICNEATNDPQQTLKILKGISLVWKLLVCVIRSSSLYRERVKAWEAPTVINAHMSVCRDVIIKDGLRGDKTHGLEIFAPAQKHRSTKSCQSQHPLVSQHSVMKKCNFAHVFSSSGQENISVSCERNCFFKGLCALWQWSIWMLKVVTALNLIFPANFLTRVPTISQSEPVSQDPLLCFVFCGWVLKELVVLVSWKSVCSFPQLVRQLL